MSDPRFTDPRYSEPPLNDPVLRREERTGSSAWGWIAGIAVVALIAFVVIAGWNGNHSNTASNTAPVTTSSTAPKAPPSTTGSGATSPQPMSPPANRSAQ